MPTNTDSSICVECHYVFQNSDVRYYRFPDLTAQNPICLKCTNNEPIRQLGEINPDAKHGFNCLVCGKQILDKYAQYYCSKACWLRDSF